MDCLPLCVLYYGALHQFTSITLGIKKKLRYGWMPGWLVGWMTNIDIDRFLESV